MDEREQSLSTADLTGTPDEEQRPDAAEVDAERETREDETRQDDNGDTAEPLLPAEDGEAFQSRWQDIQVRFVDEPQGAVKDADGLVAELMQRLASSFAEERGRLESEWERGAEVSTEDLRQALQHYRSFFNRLLSA